MINASSKQTFSQIRMTSFYKIMSPTAVTVNYKCSENRCKNTLHCIYYKLPP